MHVHQEAVPSALDQTVNSFSNLLYLLRLRPLEIKLILLNSNVAKC